MSEVSVNTVVETRETEYTRRMKDNYGFFVPVTFAYAVLYAFWNATNISPPIFSSS